MNAVDTRTYAATHRRSIENREAFWLEAAGAVEWVTAPTRALDASGAPLYRWFSDGELNTSFNALDRHVRDGRGDQNALIYDSAMTGETRHFTYRELLHEVELCAGMLAQHGVRKGDRVVIYLPMIPEAVIGMLACARLGAVHSVVFGGFAAKELATRLDDARPAVVLTASGGLEPGRTVEYLPLVADALDLSALSVTTVIVKARPEVGRAAGDFDGRGGARWVDWQSAIAGAQPHGPVTVAATDPLYILYTSGTTGQPKGVVRDNGGHAVALTLALPILYDVHAGETIVTASDIGWVVGHSFIVYAPLLVGATTVLYEGKPVGTPDAGALWRLASEHRARVLFTAPTALRAIRKVDPTGSHRERYDLSNLGALFLAGERLDPATYTWATELLGTPVVDHWWQTETGWPICCSPLGLERLELKAGSPSVPAPGYELAILDASGRPLPAGDEGNIALKLPLPPGTLSTLWGDDDRFVSSYLSAFEGYYLTGDSGFVDADGYTFVMGRTDDVINVAGHRISAGAIEEVLAQHPAVAECAVIGLNDEVKGEVPAGFVVLKSGVEVDPVLLQSELTAMVRDQIGAVAAFKTVSVVAALPKTRSGKLLRKTMRQIANGETVTVPPTIDDASVLDAITPTLRPDVGTLASGTAADVAPKGKL